MPRTVLMGCGRELMVRFSRNLLSCGVSMLVLSPAAAWAQALPTGGAYVAGSGTIGSAGSAMTITQSERARHHQLAGLLDRGGRQGPVQQRDRGDAEPGDRWQPVADRGRAELDRLGVPDQPEWRGGGAGRHGDHRRQLRRLDAGRAEQPVHGGRHARLLRDLRWHRDQRGQDCRAGRRRRVDRPGGDQHR